MENHYHLFLQTLREGLAKVMHLINMRYANYFNLKYQSCGHTFQSRFKAILVQAEVYAREVAAYIHLNPVRAGIAGRPEDYAWSNYREYLGLAPPLPWSTNVFVLSLFGQSLSESRRNYETYVLWRMSQDLPNPLDPALSSGILGQPDFIEQVKRIRGPEEALASTKGPSEKWTIPQRPELLKIKAEAEDFFGMRTRLTRKMAIYFAYKKFGYSLREVGGFFEIGNSGITDICRRLDRELVGNETIARSVRDLEHRFRA
jgi:hypothetical protein